MAATVDHISKVGSTSAWARVGTNASTSPTGFRSSTGKERFELFAEQVEIVVRSWTEERFDHSGPAYGLRDQQALPRPLQRPHPPLVLGGSVKPRFAALAARYATEVNTLGAPNEELAERRALLDRACAAAGRDPATLGFSVMTSCFLGEDRGQALDRIARFLAVRGGDADPEEMLAERRDRWLAGSVDEVVERIAELRALGVTRVFLQHLNHSDDEMVALIGERLLPSLR